jgi:hypothetical protein
MGAIIENPIYGQMTLETSAWSTPFSWVDRSAELVNGINYSLGGRVGLPGQSSVDVGTLNATFRNLTTAPLVGDLVRLRRTGTTEYAWVGYVQDVSQRIVFEPSVSYTTPVTLTTINCVDWVGYISQFQVEGIGGLSAAFAVQTEYPYQSRARALNNAIDATNATQLIAFDATAASSIIGDTDLVGTISDHLDLAAYTQNLYWYGQLVLPTNKTTGRTGLVIIRPLSTAPSSGETFTDAVGTAGQLHYTELDLESSSQNVANTIVLNNYSLITTTAPEVTKKGGANRPNFSIVNGVEEVAVPYYATWSATDATSITTYGNRATEMNSNLAGLVEDLNLVGNPSMEYGDDGWSTGANRMARRIPTFGAYHGEWALRYRLAAGPASTPSFRYSGSENDGTPVIAGTAYMFQAAGARGLGTNTDVRARAYITWQDVAGANISTVLGSQVSMATQFAWNVCTVTGTAPAGAERAIVGLEYNRSGGGTFATGDQMWLDGAMLRKSASATAVAYYDGDTPGTTASLYLWTGEVGLSPSFKVTNNLDDTIATYLSRFSTTSNRITRVRWNAQEDMTAVPNLRVGLTTTVTFKGTTTTHRIVGIDGNISTDRYMIDYYLERV